MSAGCVSRSRSFFRTQQRPQARDARTHKSCARFSQCVDAPRHRVGLYERLLCVGAMSAS